MVSLRISFVCVSVCVFLSIESLCIPSVSLCVFLSMVSLRMSSLCLSQYGVSPYLLSVCVCVCLSQYSVSPYLFSVYVCVSLSYVFLSMVSLRISSVCVCLSLTIIVDWAWKTKLLTYCVFLNTPAPHSPPVQSA